MSIAIVAGTFTLDRLLAEELGTRGHDVRVLSGSASVDRVDLRTGQGVDTALADRDVGGDASNDPDAGMKVAATRMERSRRPLGAERADVRGATPYAIWPASEGR